MRMAEHRRERLRKLIRDEYGTQTAFANAIGRQQDYVSRILSGNRGLGEDLAREIERIVGKPRGWLDEGVEQEGASLPARAAAPDWPFRAFSRTRFNRLTNDEKLLVEGAALKVILDIEAHRGAKRKSPAAGTA